MTSTVNIKNIPKKTSLPQTIAFMLFGLFLTAIILEIGLRIAGFTILSMQKHRDLQSIKQKDSFRIMCLGESTTQKQYPVCLEEILNKHGTGIKFGVIDKGKIGATTTMIVAQLETNLDKYRPDIVVTMMGCNDSGIMYYKNIPDPDTWLFQHCRAYRFVRLIYMHSLNKLNKEGIYELDDSSLSRKFFRKAFKKARELNPSNDATYRELGRLYREQGKFAESERAFNKAIKLNPNNGFTYKDLGRLYRDYGKLIESEQAFNKAIELNPENYSAYEELGFLYQCQRKFTEAEQVFKKAIELNPKDDFAYKELGRLYREQGKFAKLEQEFKKAIELNPQNAPAYLELGFLYRAHGRFAESEQVFKDVLIRNPNNNFAVRGLATIYYEMGNIELSKFYAKKADSFGDEYSNPATVNNYYTLKQILDKRNIKLVCVQYPMRNIEPLKKIFKENAWGSIIFVDNERIFKDAVRKEGYKEYFTDMFGGDFGHCTNKGNRLLAENIANGILKEISGK